MKNKVERLASLLPDRALKICCVSIDSIAHMDFGGMGFLNLAKQLSDVHDVDWVLSDASSNIDKFKKLEKKLYTNKLKMVYKLNYDISSINLDKNSVNKGIKEINQIIIENKYDLLFVDRILQSIESLLNKIGVPWVSVGGDGNYWYRYYCSLTELSIVNRFKHNSLQNSIETRVWCVSPFLNINFFPKWFYNSENSSSINVISKIKINHKKKYILVTFGNSMPEKVQLKLFNIIKKLIPVLPLSVMLLIGNSSLKSMIEEETKYINNINVYDWLDYDEAFSQASVVVGHGGSAHVWYSLKYNIPIIAIPSIADQLFNAQIIYKNDLGYYLIPKNPNLIKNLFLKFKGSETLKETTLLNCIESLIKKNKNKKIKSSYDYESLDVFLKSLIKK